MKTEVDSIVLFRIASSSFVQMASLLFDNDDTKTDATMEYIASVAAFAIADTAKSANVKKADAIQCIDNLFRMADKTWEDDSCKAKFMNSVKLLAKNSIKSM